MDAVQTVRFLKMALTDRLDEPTNMKIIRKKEKFLSEHNAEEIHIALESLPIDTVVSLHNKHFENKLVQDGDKLIIINPTYTNERSDRTINFLSDILLSYRNQLKNKTDINEAAIESILQLCDEYRQLKAEEDMLKSIDNISIDRRKRLEERGIRFY